MCACHVPLLSSLRACTAAADLQRTQTFSKYQYRDSVPAVSKCGVGIAFAVDSPQGGSLIVKGFVPTGAAAADGRIKKGDVLVAVDGLDVRALHTAQVTPLIYGGRGTVVVLGFVRALPGAGLQPALPRARSWRAWPLPFRSLFSFLICGLPDEPHGHRAATRLGPSARGTEQVSALGFGVPSLWQAVGCLPGRSMLRCLACLLSSVWH